MSKSFTGIGHVDGQGRIAAAIDWHNCVICQKNTPSQSLVCPALAKKRKTGDGYKTLEIDLLGFQSIGCLPPTIIVDSLNDGSGISNTLSTNLARWHKSCRDAINSTKLDRAKKRKLSEVVIETTNQLDSNSDSELEAGMHLSTRSSSTLHEASKENPFCFFCNQVGEKVDQADIDRLWQVRTFTVDARVRRCATVLQDFNTLARLNKTDMIALDAHYHARCLVAYYNRADRQASIANKPNNSFDIESVVLGELVAFIEEVRSNQSIAPVFKLSALKKMYSCKLQSYGVASESRVNSTRFKDSILGYFPDMLAVNESRGHETLLIFDDSLTNLLHKACQADAYSDGIHLVRAAQLIRSELFNNKYCFQGQFPSDCETKAVCKPLLTLIQMILEGPCIDDNNETFSRAALTISQLITFNSVKRSRTDHSSPDKQTSVRHARSQETPLPIYTALLLHSATRKRQLVDKMYHLGLSVSYDRMLQISTDVANSVCKIYSVDDVVCPTGLQPGLFTLAAFDNIDHNPSSATAQHSFHGTSMSLMQNRFQSNQTAAVSNHFSSPVTCSEGRTVNELPVSYTRVKPCTVAPASSCIPIMRNLSELMKQIPQQMLLSNDIKWLRILVESISTDVWPENVSWAAYHASQNLAAEMWANANPALISLLPLFGDSAHSYAMIKHGMECIFKAVNKLNGSQIPVIAFDQPLYAMAKTLQWTLPDVLGEGHFVLLLGGLHIEMAAWKAVGDWLAGSGWTDVIENANIATYGTADSFLKASHVKRTRLAHIVTAASLYVLRHRAYADYLLQDANSSNALNFDDWCITKNKECPQFAYWNSVLLFELTVLTMIRAIRTQDFSLYCQSLIQLVPWFFALDHTHYARWLPVHIRDMVTLDQLHPQVASEFKKGNFVVCKSSKPFSSIAVDHAHEQSNKIIKDDGGAIGLTGNEHGLRRWMVAGPEVARMINEFEGTSNNNLDTKHHEQTQSFENRFIKNVTSLIETFEQYDNPFMAEHADLVSIISKIVATDMVSNTVRDAYILGQKQYADFVADRLSERTVPITAVIKRNNFALFTSVPIRKPCASKLQLTAAKNDSALFSRLYIASQCRDGDLDTFFQHENQPYPPALSLAGDMRHGVKSDLLDCLPKQKTIITQHPSVECVILDGAVIVQMSKPGLNFTFSDYACKLYSDHIEPYLKYAVRADVVFDVYKPNSLKSGIRSQRGTGFRQHVSHNGKVPRNWQQFLRADENKTELFTFLATEITAYNPVGKVIVATVHEHVVSCGDVPINFLSPCSHEEADTRMLLHARHASEAGIKTIMLRTVDTDVVVIGIACVEKLKLDTFWIAFGVGKHFRYLALHEIANIMGPQKSTALPLFHALTGCDTVSSFSSRGKKSAYDTWTDYPDLTDCLLQLSRDPCSLNQPQVFSVIEQFVVLMYDRTSNTDSVNTCRQQLFSRKGRTMETIPPTRDALVQHVKRACYQAVFIWNQALYSCPSIPIPSEWGWEIVNGKLSPVWVTIPHASKVCSELLKCGCKKGCLKSCKCCKALLKCTSLCNCGATCENSGEKYDDSQ